ncbi:ryncolin-1-like [Actinia tenebrosa]|uniref:Ryncolin-1-like n=1 Tax=Actinia tenebrosa TaxID=6105 RepID=A0A6P8IIK1_ACTTE|nr:ryncolin-1-like [Actinia tenebrosa]
MIFSYRSCAEVPLKISGVYHIHPISQHPVPVFCDMTTTGGDWTVIQKRMDGSVDFYRNWDDYKWGFGNKSGEYWLGLENIHAMTSQGTYRLRFDLEDFEGNTRYAEYNSFLVSSEADNYRVTIGSYSGTAGDSFNSAHNGRQFSTKDRDNDSNDAGHCAVLFTGAWWYNGCHNSNPNGQYLGGPNYHNGKGINWYTWLGLYYSLKKVEIKIRPV